MNKQMNSIGREAAIALGETKWWEGKTHREIAEVQLFTQELCCPFNVFHEAVAKSLDRPVFTHEFGLDYEGLCKEFLGEKEAPNLESIINLIPESKRVLVVTEAA